MASALYDSYKQGLLDLSAPSLATGIETIRCIFMPTGTYTFSAAHQFFSSLAGTQGDGGTARTNGEAIVSPTITNGVYDAADTVFASVTGTTLNSIAIYDDNTTDGDSKLVAYIDGWTAISPSAAQVTIQWDTNIFSF